jgi:predicted transcriptional regulator
LQIGITGVILMCMKTAISIPDDVFEAAEATARRLGMSRSRLYATAIAEYVRQHTEDGVREKLDEIYPGQPSELDPVLESMQKASVFRDEW